MASIHKYILEIFSIQNQSEHSKTMDALFTISKLALGNAISEDLEINYSYPCISFVRPDF